MDPEEVVEERLEVGEALVIEEGEVGEALVIEEEGEVEARLAEGVVAVLVLAELQAEVEIQTFHGLEVLEGVVHDE